jgi:hypothetical protein
LKRWKRSRGFLQNLQEENYIFLRGLDCKSSSFLHGCCTEASCRPKLERFRPWESTGSGGKERGEGGGSIPCLTRSGDAPRRSNFARENSKVGSVLFLSVCSCSWRFWTCSAGQGRCWKRGRYRRECRARAGQGGGAGQVWAHEMQKDGILVVAVLQRRRRMQEGERTRQKRWAGVQAHRGSRERENGAGAALGAAGGARRRGKTRAGATCGAAGETHARRWLRMGARGGGGEKYEQGRCGLGLRENL